MKCLICKTNVAAKILPNVKSNYPCFCHTCFWNFDYEYEYLEEVLRKHLKEVGMPELKFPTDEEYPEGYKYFAYDLTGSGYFYKDKPEPLSTAWTVETGKDNYEEADGYVVYEDIPNWKETLREKSTTEDNINPNYYKWHPVCEAVKITQEFTTNFGCAINYIWRVASPDARKFDSKQGRIQDLEKAIRHLEFEIERIEAE